MFSSLIAGVGVIVALLVLKRILSALSFIIALAGLYAFLSGNDGKVGNIRDLKNKVPEFINTKQLERLGNSKNLNDILKNAEGLVDVKKIQKSIQQLEKNSSLLNESLR